MANRAQRWGVERAQARCCVACCTILLCAERPPGRAVQQEHSDLSHDAPLGCPPVGSMAANSGAEASAVKMPSRPSGATPML